MKKYAILIEETVTEEFEIFAENEEDALEKARQKHKTTEFVLEPGELQHVKITIIKPTTNDIR